MLRWNTHEVLADITFRMVAFFIAWFMVRVVPRCGELQNQVYEWVKITPQLKKLYVTMNENKQRGSSPHNQWLVGCKHGSGSIQDARMHSSNLDIVHNQSPYCSERKSYYENN